MSDTKKINSTFHWSIRWLLFQQNSKYCHFSPTCTVCPSFSFFFFFHLPVSFRIWPAYVTIPPQARCSGTLFPGVLTVYSQSGEIACNKRNDNRFRLHSGCNTTATVVAVVDAIVIVCVSDGLHQWNTVGSDNGSLICSSCRKRSSF